MIEGKDPHILGVGASNTEPSLMIFSMWARAVPGAEGGGDIPQYQRRLRVAVLEPVLRHEALPTRQSTSSSPTGRSDWLRTA